MAISRDTIARPSIRREAIEVTGLGEVVIRQMHLSEMLAITARQYEADPDAAPAADGFQIETGRFDEAVQILSWCVVDADGRALMSVEEWQIWGAQNFAEACHLITRVQALSRAEKKTPALNTNSPDA